MEKVLLLGDTHGNINAVQKAFIEAEENGCIAIIQLGDFGFGWGLTNGTDIFSQAVSHLAKEFAIPLYWLDGNHENFDVLFSDAISLDENGHSMYMPGVTYLSRGSILTLGETKFMAFGGAYSVDKKYRTPGVSWWPQETCTEDDLNIVKKNCDPGRRTVDVFLSHDAPLGAQGKIEQLKEKLERDWGPDAFTNSYINQMKVREALDLSGAERAFHGHIHSSYVQHLDNDPEKCLVRALNCDGTPDNTYILEV